MSLKLLPLVGVLIVPSLSWGACEPTPQQLASAETEARGYFNNSRILSASAKIADFALKPGNGLVSEPIDGREASYSEKLAERAAKGIQPVGAVSQVAESLSGGGGAAPSDRVFEMIARWVPRNKKKAMQILSIIGADGALPPASGAFENQLGRFVSQLHSSRAITPEDAKALRGGGGLGAVEKKVAFYLKWTAAGSRTIVMGVDENGDRPEDGSVLAPVAGGFLSCGHVMNGG
jgi:hypothetical protein